MPSDIYKYNSDYNAYEDMCSNEECMKNLYDNALNLKIVGVVTAKERVTSMALMPGVSYRSELIDYIIDYDKETDIVKKQLKDDEINVISGKRFDDNSNSFNFDFKDLVSINTKILKSAFRVDIDEKAFENQINNFIK